MNIDDVKDIIIDRINILKTIYGKKVNEGRWDDRLVLETYGAIQELEDLYLEIEHNSK